MLQMFRLMDFQLKRVNMDLKLRPYAVLATCPDDGMVEMVPDSCPISEVLSEWRSIQQFLRSEHYDKNAEYMIDPKVGVHVWLCGCVCGCVAVASPCKQLCAHVCNYHDVWGSR